jgi:hypothetical protein
MRCSRWGGSIGAACESSAPFVARFPLTTDHKDEDHVDLAQVATKRDVAAGALSYDELSLAALDLSADERAVGQYLDRLDDVACPPWQIIRVEPDQVIDDPVEGWSTSNGRIWHRVMQ